ncbi:C-type lectin domain family 2 member l [Plakobranchus ocellatus]|uniref:C-type lectin domain family 2 member l n=1 Tax=Plakobranchus ocellatus TaxID=259542 RepID=A0AAV4BBL5_9GAST|nr:C-type lectin domain family 2 member l [Plakobranchus ocellatus]
MIQLIICLVTIAFVAVKAADPPCPGGFSYYGGSCYHVDDGGYYFYQSRDRCELKDSELVAIQSNEENKFIQGLLRGDDATGAWIGVVLVDDDGGQWVNSNTYDEQKFTYWADSRMGSPKGRSRHDFS